MIRQYNVVGLDCDKCSDDYYTDGQTRFDDEDNMIADAKEDGWVKFEGEWHCPDCAKGNDKLQNQLAKDNAELEREG